MPRRGRLRTHQLLALQVFEPACDIQRRLSGLVGCGRKRHKRDSCGKVSGSTACFWPFLLNPQFGKDVVWFEFGNFNECGKTRWHCDRTGITTKKNKEQ